MEFEIILHLVSCTLNLSKIPSHFQQLLRNHTPSRPNNTGVQAGTEAGNSRLGVEGCVDPPERHFCNAGICEGWTAEASSLPRKSNAWRKPARNEVHEPGNQPKKIQEEGRKNLSNGSKKIQPRTHGFQTAKITRISSCLSVASVSSVFYWELRAASFYYALTGLLYLLCLCGSM